MFWVTFERTITNMALNNMPAVLILFVVVVALAVVVAIRYNKKITEAQADRETQKLLIKQLGKAIKLVGDLPCVSKRNATRLADPKQDGNFPDRPECNYSTAVEKGEI
jgi:membrane protein implicated in regulation of membrane protease activity